jgi:integrase
VQNFVALMLSEKEDSMAEKAKKQTPVKRLTDNYVRSRKPAKPGERDFTRSADHRRVLLCVTDKLGPDNQPHRSFLYGTVRFPGDSHPTRRELGIYPAMSIAQAHEKAREWDVMIEQGTDPRHEEQRRAEEQKRKVREEALAGANVFETRTREYLRQHCKEHRQARETGRLIDKDLMPSWRDRRIDQITPREIKALILEIAERSPSTARNVLTVIKSFFSWAVDLDHIETSPAASIKPKRLIGEKKPRTRVLSDHEIVKFWRATGELAYPYRQLYRLLLLTGTRLREAANAPWTEFGDLDRRLWVIEPERFKSDIRHIVPLSDQAMQVIEELPRCGPYLFSFNGTSPINSFSKSKERLDQLMGVSDWRVHDLRRVVRSKLAALGVPELIGEMALGHGRRGLGRIYDQHRYEPELRDALQQWGNALRDLTTPPPSNLVKLPKRRKVRAA